VECDKTIESPMDGITVDDQERVVRRIGRWAEREKR
jgi:hypothetical protein